MDLTKRNMINELREEISESITHLNAFPYIYENLSAFGLNTDKQELLGIINSTAKIEQVYINHLAQSYEQLHDLIINMQNDLKGEL
ncbi:hypothetical protein EV694_1549 [Volucribacter psittacicida]|uniref:Uncharacterized protein n=1 Tax=Volucribacter psittacicida TaxID=203482 RepID=A0A4R1FSY3_9PAST|nr:hypothetical protein [Volucribacter psittacicida]TCJ97953.1 hypothetical protein EV694_1549 [Volucribacter psittacicida]